MNLGKSESFIRLLPLYWFGRHQGLSRYINYGTHEGNEFHYNHTQKTLSVTYFGELVNTI